MSQPIFLRALQRLPIDRTPLWIMRQAGRYLPEYRTIRAQVPSFLELCQTVELATEITLLPLKRFNLDAAILFSDILLLPAKMGLDLSFETNQGPCFSNPIRTISQIKNLLDIEPEEALSNVLQTIKLLNKELPTHQPLIGFAGSPWTVATYMVEGQASKNFVNIKKFMFEQSEIIDLLLNKLSQATTKYLLAQINAGAKAVMLFDSWAGILSPWHYEKFSLDYIKSITQAIKQQYPSIPVIIYSKNSGLHIQKIAQTGCQAIGLDWTVDLNQARLLVGNKVALQGNLDPCVLYTNPETINLEVEKVLSSFGEGSGHIFNLGHGIHPTIPIDNVHALIDAVARYSPQYHNNLQYA